jgi:hypothetical protein
MFSFLKHSVHENEDLAQKNAVFINSERRDAWSNFRDDVTIYVTPFPSR